MDNPIFSSNARRLSFFITPPHPCGYLKDRDATNLLTDPHLLIDNRLYSILVEHGFRRSGSLVYRPHCQGCNACIPVRIPVTLFQARRSQRRAWVANQDLNVHLTRPILHNEQYRLFRHYISTRHVDSGMDGMSMIDYLQFLTSPAIATGFYEIRLGERLCAVAVIDHLTDGLSAVYTYYDPELSNRSLGVYAILWAIEECRQRNLPYLYMGYWIGNCRKMSYKEQYRPLEGYINNHWVPIPTKT